MDFFTLTWVFTEDPSSKHPIYFSSGAKRYRLFGLILTDIHLFGTITGEPVFLLGTDRLGRDLLSRIIYGGQISLTVGLVGVVLTIFSGTSTQHVSGCYGGAVDNGDPAGGRGAPLLPTSPCGRHSALAMPPDWAQIAVLIGVGVILSLRNWTGGLPASCGKSAGAVGVRLYHGGKKRRGVRTLHHFHRFSCQRAKSHRRHRHALRPRHDPGGDGFLSFLGLGIQPPMASWGVLLQDGAAVSVVLNSPWLLLPGLFVVFRGVVV